MEENSQKPNKVRIGRLGEEFAAGLLELKGYEILERNFRCRIGEIDLIAKRDDEICFVEVKTRNTDVFGRPAASVDVKKQSTIRRAASFYLLRKDINDVNVSFQVMEIYINHIEHAFY